MKRHFIIGLCALAVLGADPAAAGGPPALFDGKTLDNWTTLDGDPVAKGWEVVRGKIHLDRDQGKAGHIISKHEYGDFILSFDWKIAKGGNSGLKYRVRKYGNKTLGLEYQVLDDPNTKEGKTKSKNSAGSLYDLYAPNYRKHLNRTGRYNHARIVVRGDTIQHWLNGQLIVTATVGGKEWKRRIAESKFDGDKDFGENRLGKIMLTDHGAETWYKNLKLEPLPMGKK